MYMHLSTKYSSQTVYDCYQYFEQSLDEAKQKDNVDEHLYYEHNLLERYT